MVHVPWTNYLLLYWLHFIVFLYHRNKPVQMANRNKSGVCILDETKTKLDKTMFHKATISMFLSDSFTDREFAFSIYS